MDKTALNFKPSFFDTYINKVPDGELRQSIKSHGLPIIETHRDRWQALGNQVYESGKWTIKEVIQHIIDTERVFAFRALWMARGSGSALPGFDQDIFNQKADANQRAFNDLIKEMICVRQSTIYLYDSISDEALLNKGTASDLEMNPLALGYMIVGHLIHHVEIIEERYYPLLANQQKN